MRARLLFLLGCLSVVVGGLAENTKTISVTFDDFSEGAYCAVNEKHDLREGLVIYTTDCHFTTELRIYSSTSNNGYVVSDPLPGIIASVSFRMGYNKDVLNVYGSTDKENWTLIKGVETTSTSYKNYTLNFPLDKNYTCFKLDVKGEKQIRIESMSVIYICDGEGNDGDNDEEITVSTPIFTPGTSVFSTESLNVSIDMADGCEVYYTTDGTAPSYTSTEEYVGTKGNVVTIHSSPSPVILKAIAVNVATGKCSEVASATYTYVDPANANDGSEERPYTVAEAKAMTGEKNNKWVKGTIYGTMANSYDFGQGIITSGFKSSANIVIGDSDIQIPVQLPSGSDIREGINLVDHPCLVGKEILIKGTLKEYCGTRGVQEPTEYKVMHDIPINSYGYATLFLDMPVSVPEGSTAYYCDIEDNYVDLLPIGTVVPANVGIIIESTPNTTCRLTYTVEENANKDSILFNNLLVGFTKDTLIVADGNAYYALNVRDNQIGFYIPQTAMDETDATSGFTARANKSYLRVPAELKATRFLFRREQDETGIGQIFHLCDDVVYDLQGRRVSYPKSGIYIKSGKKIVIRN